MEVERRKREELRGGEGQMKRVRDGGAVRQRINCRESNGRTRREAAGWDVERGEEEVAPHVGHEGRAQTTRRRSQGGHLYLVMSSAGYSIFNI